MRVAYIGGFWATNIGNAFYNLGLLHALKETNPSSEIYFVPDPFGWFWKSKNARNIIQNLEVDRIIISGPCFNANLEYVYKEIFELLNKRGIEITFLSSGLSKYTKIEVQSVYNFLRNFNIKSISTRDSISNEMMSNYFSNVHDGICGVGFIKDGFKPAPLNLKDHIVYSFKYLSEPVFDIRQDKFVKRNIFSKFDRSIFGKEIIRLDHSSFNSLSFINYNRPNTYYSDLPYGYLSILAAAESVYTDRVHCCAAAGIYGRRVRYFTNSRRAKDGRYFLLEKLGLGSVIDNGGFIDQSIFERNRMAMVEYLNNEFWN